MYYWFGCVCIFVIANGEYKKTLGGQTACARHTHTHYTSEKTCTL